MAGGKSLEKALDWSDPLEIDEVIRAISGCEKYRDGGGAVEIVRTRISIIILTPTHVFKFKRPQDFGFTDFSRLKKRRHYCKEELRLNRRLARGVYLEVMPLCAEGDGYRFGRGDAIVDYAVVMNRLGGERMLSRLVAEEGLEPAELDGLAKRLVEFHGSAPLGREPHRFGSLWMLNQKWEESFAQAVPFINFTITANHFQELQQAVFSFLTRNRALLEQRVRDGFIRDGHGDLRCEHIYLTKPIKIIDCIDFSDRCRIGDVAFDLAGLLLDLSVLGRPDLSRYMLEKYMSLSGDRELMRLVPFYACYRAFMRGNVMSEKLSAANLPPEEQHRIMNRARSFFLLSRSLAEQMAPPALLLIAGSKDYNRTALGAAIARETGIVLLSSDRLTGRSGRGVGHESSGPLAHETSGGHGARHQEERASSDQILFDQAVDELQQGHSVVLSAPLHQRKTRTAAFDLARSHGAKAFLVEFRFPVQQRTEGRAGQQPAGNHFTREEGARPSLAEAFEPIDELGAESHLVVPANQPVEVLLKKVLAHPRVSIPPALFSTPGAGKPHPDPGG